MYLSIFIFIYGFIAGFFCNCLQRIYMNYREYNNIKKTIAYEAYTYVTNNIFNMISDDIITNIDEYNINGINNLIDFKNIIDSSIYIIHDINKLFKIKIIDGKIQLRLLNSSYINNEHFVRLCKFFTENNINLHIILEENNLLNKIKY